MRNDLLAVITFTLMLAGGAHAEEAIVRSAPEPPTYVFDGCLIGAATGVVVGTVTTAGIATAPGAFGGCFVGGVVGYYGPSAAWEVQRLSRMAYEETAGHMDEIRQAASDWWASTDSVRMHK